MSLKCFQEINYNKLFQILIVLNLLEKLFMELKVSTYLLDIVIPYIKELNQHIKFVKFSNKMKNMKVKIYKNIRFKCKG